MVDAINEGRRGTGRVVKLGWWECGRAVEPDRLVLVDVEVALERITERGMVRIEVAEVGAIDRVARKEARRDIRQLTGGEGLCFKLGEVKAIEVAWSSLEWCEFVGTVAGGGDNTVGTADLVRELGDSTNGRIALNLNSG